MYIPLSNIAYSKYTNGGEYVIKSNFQEYVGFYFVDKTGNAYTGQTYTNNSVELQNVNPNANTKTTQRYDAYSSLKPQILPATSFTPDIISPTNQDYSNEFFVRYLLKPTISSQINDFIEVKFNKYNQIQQSKDLQILYKSASVIWKIAGPLYDIYENNIRTVSGIIDTNKRSIQEVEKDLPNISLYFTDLTQFGRPS